jgi:hypothetical protein
VRATCPIHLILVYVVTLITSGSPVGITKMLQILSFQVFKVVVREVSLENLSESVMARSIKNSILMWIPECFDNELEPF